MKSKKISNLLKKNQFLIGETFGRLTILEIYYKINPCENKNRLFCKCSCSCSDEKIVDVMYNKIQTKNTLSCGCIKKDGGKIWSENHRKKNEYRVICENTYVKFNNCDKEFIIDSEDLDRVIAYGWYEDGGYAKGSILGESIKLHRFILNAPPNTIVDHIDRNTYNNKKENLRITISLINRINSKKRKDNTSGITGVYKRGNLWYSSISIKGEKINKSFKIFEDAVRDRLSKEQNIFGEYSPQKYLFDEYGIL